MSAHATCEMPGSRCRQPATKVVEFTNHFGKAMRIGLCDKHVEVFTDPEVQDRLRGRALQTWQALDSQRSAEEMLEHPAQKALLAHQDGCAQCASVRDYIVGEQQHGRIRSSVDVNRIGQFVMDNCCSVGVQLNYEVGKAMRGLA